jgi:type II secretory ATPase GspE/PulE/Tfp pilus assembly ATPase PilB-like protein
LFGALTWGLIHTLPYDKREVALCGLVVMALITLYRRSYPNGYSALRRGRKKEVRRLCRSEPVVRLVEILLRTAALDNVHQVVLIPQARQGKVQFRRSDHPVHETRLPLHLLRLVEERFKQMCDLPLHNAPQEWVGSFRFVHNDRRYGVLARTVATAWGAQTTLQIVPETE